MTVKTTLLILKLMSIVNFTKTEFEGFIVGGSFSEIERFPHSAFITTACHGRSFSCGASVLNNALLITAAHCVYICNDTNFTIKAYTGSKEKNSGFESNVISYKVHDNYNKSHEGGDIALLLLEKELIFGRTVKKVVLMKKPPSFKTAVVAGWGWIDTNGTKSDFLKYADQQVISWNECYWRLGIIPKGTFCGRDLKSFPGRGDSGSALVVRDSILIGIVSFKKNYYTNDTTVYTDVPYFYDWIVKNARDMYCDGEK